MSDYTQITDFSAKDALPSGNAEKAISGADVDGEFAAISTAIATKVDEPASPSAGEVLYYNGSWVAQDLGADGTAGEVFRTDGTNASWGSPLTIAGAQQPTTSGTSVTFSSIPDWVQQITFNFRAFSTNGTAVPEIQLGDAGGLETSGYLGGVTGLAGGASSGNHSSGFALSSNWTASTIAYGSITLSLVDAASFIWAASGVLGYSNTAATSVLGGTKTLTAALDRVAIVSSDTFNGGAVNILYG